MKRFYNNTLISGAFSKVLRVVALLCVLLGVSSSAWAGGTRFTSNRVYLDISAEQGWKDGGAVIKVQFCTWDNMGNGAGYSNPINMTACSDGVTYYADVSSIVSSTAYYGVQFLRTNPNDGGTWDSFFISAQEPNTYNGGKLTGWKSGTIYTYSGDCSSTPDPTLGNYVISVYPNGGGAEVVRGTFTTVSGTIMKSTFTIPNYTGNTSDYQFWVGKNNAWENGKSAEANLNNYIQTCSSGTMSINIDTNSSASNYGPQGGECIGGSGDDDPLDECDAVEIWARSKGSYTDMICKVSSGNATSTGIKSYNGNNYATWKVSTKNDIAVNFCARDNASYCTNAKTMSPGNRYICEFEQDKWGSQDYTIIVTQPLDCADQPTDVLLSQMPLVNKATKQATLYGYLKQTHCENIADYGFYYCRVLDGEKCKPNTESVKLQANPSPQLKRSQEFKAILDLEDGYTYYYRAYAVVGEETLLSQEIRSISTDPCVQQACCGAPIVYTIDASLPNENQCKLQFLNLQDAIDHLKESSSRKDAYAYTVYTDGSYNLQQPVVMNVVYYDDTPEDPTSAYIYRGTTDVGVYAGDNKPANANLIQDFNKSANADPANTLTIKAGTKVAKPWIHHLVIRNSRNIVLDSLCIYSDPNKVGDNALEIDVNSIGWDVMTTGQFADANIVIQNSMIGSDGFTGVHVSAYDGITFKKNDFEIVFEGKTTDGNVLNWSASAKFMMCKNIKFIQNNFRGSQPTMLWLQECQNALFMNNVFWNTNTFVPAEGSKAVVPSAVRLVSQYANEIDNIGFYYNTFYFANNDINAPWAKYNFFNQYLAYTKASQANIGKYGSNIYFKYNNCYSYDKDCPGMYDIVGSATGGGADMTYTTVTATSDSENFCPNNFWSQYDQDKLDKGETVTKSAFAFGCSENDFVNVKGQVCETTATGPASLIVKGTGMDYGVKPDISTTGITLEPNEQYADRYLIGARPANGEKWTYGAYQSKDNIDTELIYWVGVTDDWDDRNNWEYETEVDGKMVRQRVSCVNNFSEDLKVVVEEIGTLEIAGGRKWPKVPASFNPNDRKTESGVPVGEQVSAGLGKAGFTPTKFASTIELEYGAGLRGVENLKEADGKTLRYDRAITHFDAPRDRWLLVGTVVKPFVDEKAGTTRNIISRDYYMDFLPQIYMHQTVVDGDTVSWTRTFPDLDKEVEPTTVFAINASNYYGKYYESAATYNKWNGTNYDGTAPIPYSFTGRFAVEEGATGKTPYAFTATANATNLLNNNYPCNIDALKIEELDLGTVNVYDYENASFVSTTAYKTLKETDKVFIKAQNGFVFTPAKGKSSLQLTDDILAEGSTRTRSTQVQLPTFSLQVDNANTTAPGASNVVVVLDEAQPANYSSPLNTPKVFTRNEDTPEAYIVSGNENCSRLYVDGDTKRIPLGIRLQKAMNITFEKVYSIDFSKVILLDAKTGKEYNLLERNYTTEKLLVSENNKDIVNRFFLVLEQEEYLPDDDVVTDVEDVVEGADINVYAVNGNTIRVVSTGVDLQSIYVSDMAGRTMKYEANGHFVELQLPVAQGVYMVHVIGDNATRTEKVVLK